MRLVVWLKVVMMTRRMRRRRSRPCCRRSLLLEMMMVERSQDDVDECNAGRPEAHRRFSIRPNRNRCSRLSCSTQTTRATLKEMERS